MGAKIATLYDEKQRRTATAYEGDTISPPVMVEQTGIALLEGTYSKLLISCRKSTGCFGTTARRRFKESFEAFLDYRFTAYLSEAAVGSVP